MVKLTEEKARVKEIKKLVARLMGDPKDAERAIQILTKTGVRTEEQLRKTFALANRMKGSLLAVLLESEMDSKTAKGLRLAIPHLISLAQVAHAPGFKERFKAHLELGRKRLSQME